jgi:hypothetical protein
MRVAAVLLSVPTYTHYHRHLSFVLLVQLSELQNFSGSALTAAFQIHGHGCCLFIPVCLQFGRQCRSVLGILLTFACCWLFCFTYSSLALDCVLSACLLNLQHGPCNNPCPHFTALVLVR